VKRTLPDAKATEAFGAALAKALGARSGVVIYLSGELGTGKTTLVRGLLHALGVEGSIRSPTYTLIEPYRAGGKDVVHLDLYRIADPLELANLGLADFPPGQTWWLIEWPERAGSTLPSADLELSLRHVPEGREVAIGGPLADNLLKEAALQP
jgi:tRNA threonylcarbamoyladenosine biosynthesis protein TsaE